MFGIAVVTLVLGFAVVRGGLVPFNDMRRRLADVQKGTERQLRGDYPAEVQPLVDDLNALLAHREAAVSRALAKAGDLAHGLKTPLAVLSQEAERAAAAGHADLASAIDEQVERMRRQIEYHLAHARAASGATPGARCAVIASAEPLARTLLRLHAERGITIDVRVPADHAVRCQREDLDEMLGNLLDNACKWAKLRVNVTSSCHRPTAWSSLVDDDGPGLAPSMREAVLQRGGREGRRARPAAPRPRAPPRGGMGGRARAGPGPRRTAARPRPPPPAPRTPPAPPPPPTSTRRRETRPGRAPFPSGPSSTPATSLRPAAL